MTRLIAAICIVLICTTPAFCGEFFVDYGLGFLHSSGSQLLEARYQRDTSSLFGRPSFYQLLVDYWTGDESAMGVGFVRGIQWHLRDDHYSSASFGVMGISHPTGHLGTRYQFHFRYAYNFKAGGSDLQVAFTHISNGKLIFGWHGPNSGENFLSLSVRFF